MTVKLMLMINYDCKVNVGDKLWLTFMLTINYDCKVVCVVEVHVCTLIILKQF